MLISAFRPLREKWRSRRARIARLNASRYGRVAPAMVGCQAAAANPRC